MNKKEGHLFTKSFKSSKSPLHRKLCFPDETEPNDLVKGGSFNAPGQVLHSLIYHNAIDEVNEHLSDDLLEDLARSLWGKRVFTPEGQVAGVLFDMWLDRISLEGFRKLTGEYVSLPAEVPSVKYPLVRALWASCFIPTIAGDETQEESSSVRGEILSIALHFRCGGRTGKSDPDCRAFYELQPPGLSVAASFVYANGEGGNFASKWLKMTTAYEPLFEINESKKVKRFLHKLDRSNNPLIAKDAEDIQDELKKEADKNPLMPKDPR